MHPKQAVLLIHGIGEQRPMDTLRGFVDSVWIKHREIHDAVVGATVWSKPDEVSRSYEVRRLTTGENVQGRRTDFFEFYWAHLLEGTTYSHVIAWAKTLLLRKPSTVPAQLQPVYWSLIVSLVIAGVLLLLGASLKAAGVLSLPAWLSLITGALIVPAAGWVMQRVVGDAARYLHVAPQNIQSRHAIRSAGVALLKELHSADRRYERIIVVGHSLGSVIAYDILNHAWADYHNKAAYGSMKALDVLEGKLAEGRASVADFQGAQRAYFEELRSNGNPWRVTDLVTLGSPLAHAAILLASDAGGLEQKQADREFPKCPPILETSTEEGTEVRRLSFRVQRSNPRSHRVPHHAAVFGPTRWTNLFFPCRRIVEGDLVGGPLQGVMGAGIRDVPVSTDLRNGFFSHTLYWSLKPGASTASHVEALRDSIDLIDRNGSVA